MAKEKVLVIDDEEDACWLVSKILQDNNFSVITAATGAEGMKQLEEHVEEMGLVFLDLKLPDIDGMRLCKTIREKNIPVVIMTAYGNEGARESASEMGVIDFIDKPLKVERILELTREVIGKPAQKEKPVSSKEEKPPVEKEPMPQEEEKKTTDEVKETPEKEEAVQAEKEEVVAHKEDLKIPEKKEEKKVKAGKAGKAEQAPVNVQEKAQEPVKKSKKPVVSMKFIVFIVVFVLVGGIFYKGKITLDKANQLSLRGDYISSVEWYVKGLTINPWNKGAKEKLQKAKDSINEKIAKKQAERSENFEAELSEKKRELGEKNEEIFGLNEKIKELNSVTSSMKEKEAELLVEIEAKVKLTERLNSEKAELILQNNTLTKKFVEFDEESKKSLQKVELIKEENLGLHETINGFKKETGRLKERVSDLEPDAMRVRAVSEMMEDVKRARGKLLRERMEFIKLENTRASFRKKEQAGFNTKREMELEENPGEGGLPSALNFIKAGDYDSACKVLADILAKEPDNNEVKLLLNMVISTSTTQDTTKYFQKFLKTPQDRLPAPSLQKALEYISSRRYQEAEKELGRLLESEPSNTIAGELILRVRVLKKLNNS